VTQLSLLQLNTSPPAPTMRGYVKALDSGGTHVELLENRSGETVFYGPYAAYCEDTLRDALFSRLPVDVTVVDGKVDSIVLREP
jgi:hypothetical protein